MAIPVTLIPGDGIGPSIADATVRILAAAGAEIEWDRQVAGMAGVARWNDPIPDATLDSIKRTRVALKGPLETPVGEGFRSINVALRKTFDLYANVRPAYTIVPGRFDNVDIVLVRENTEGLYAGIENEIAKGVCTSIKVATDSASRRIADYAFRYCRERGRKKLSVFHKANIMKLTDGLFIRCAREVHDASYQDIEYEEVIIDAACMKMVQDPTRFDVILAENLYGDIMSDLCAGLVGGLGVTPGSNIGEKGAVFEAVHGSAPDIAGKGIANPLALIMSGVMMLNWLSTQRGDPRFRECATRIRNAYDRALAESATTRDLGGTLGTLEFAEALIKRF